MHALQLLIYKILTGDLFEFKNRGNVLSIAGRYKDNHERPIFDLIAPLSFLILSDICLSFGGKLAN